MALQPPDPDCPDCKGTGMMLSDWPCHCAISVDGINRAGVTDGPEGTRVVPFREEKNRETD